MVLFRRHDPHDAQKLYLSSVEYLLQRLCCSATFFQRLHDQLPRDKPRILEQLKATGVEVIGEVEEFEYGKFTHIMDPRPQIGAVGAHR